MEPGESFEITLPLPGVYDYFCAPHEATGMVGRVIVGRPGGPGTLPFDYFEGESGSAQLACRSESRTSRIPADRGDHEGAPRASDSLTSAGNRLRGVREAQGTVPPAHALVCDRELFGRRLIEGATGFGVPLQRDDLDVHEFAESGT